MADISLNNVYVCFTHNSVFWWFVSAKYTAAIRHAHDKFTFEALEFNIVIYFQSITQQYILVINIKN
jgi:hypothetical protein